MPLSVAALTLLNRRLSGERVPVTDETRPIYQELDAAGLMEPLHTFALGPNSHYRLTEAGVKFNGQSIQLPSCATIPSPRG